MSRPTLRCFGAALICFLIAGVWPSRAMGEDLLAVAQELFLRNEFTSARGYYERFLKDNPKDPKAQAVKFMVAECAWAAAQVHDQAPASQLPGAGGDKNAGDFYEAVVRMDVKSAAAQGARFRLNEILYNAGFYEEALRSWDRFLSRYPESYLKGEVVLSKALALAALSRWKDVEKALDYLVRYNAIYNSNDQVKLLNGLAAFARKEPTAALEHFQKLTKPTPASLYYAGRCYIDLDKGVLASQKFQELISNHKDSEIVEESQYLLGVSYLTAKDYSRSARQFEKFLVDYPSSTFRWSASYKFGVALFSEGNYVASREAMQSVLEIVPLEGEDKDLAWRQGVAAGKSPVVSALRDLPATTKEIGPWALYIIGESYLKEKRYREAGLAYAKVAGTWNEHPLAGYSLFRLAWCLYQEQDNAAAQGNLMRLIESYPNHPGVPYAQIMLGNLVLARGRVAEAARYYQQAADATMPQEIGEAALAMAIRAHFGNANFDSLVSAYNLNLNSYPPTDKMWRAWTQLYVAEGYYRRGHFSQAEQAFGAILKQYPASPCWVYALDGLAWSYFKEGRYELALKERERLAALRGDERVPKDLIIRNDYEKANALFNLKKYAEAIEQYERFLSANQESELLAQAKYRMGQAYAQLGYHGQAIEVWKSVRREYPQSPMAPSALWNVADTYFRAAQYDQAISHFQEHLTAYFNEGKQPQARLRIAQSYYNAQRYEAALEAFQALILNHPESAEAREGINFLMAILEMPNFRNQAQEKLNNVAKYLGSGNNMGAQAQMAIAMSFFNNQEFARAADDFEKLGNSNLPADRLADREYYLAEAYYRQNLWKQAAGAFGRMIQNFLDDARVPFAKYRLGTCFFKQESFVEAATAFEDLAQKHPSSEYAPGALYNAAQSYKSAKDWLKAENVFLWYIQKYPEKIRETGVREVLADVYEEEKKFVLAIEQIDLVRRDEKKTEDRWGELSQRIAGLYLLDGQEPLAMKEYEGMLAHLPARDLWRTTAAVRLGELYEKAERWKDAVKIYDALTREAAKPETAQAARSRIEYVQANHPEAFQASSKQAPAKEGLQKESSAQQSKEQLKKER